MPHAYFVAQPIEHSLRSRHSIFSILSSPCDVWMRPHCSRLVPPPRRRPRCPFAAAGGGALRGFFRSLISASSFLPVRSARTPTDLDPSQVGRNQSAARQPNRSHSAGRRSNSEEARGNVNNNIAGLVMHSSARRVKVDVAAMMLSSI